MPPETLKDCLSMDLKVPKFYIMPTIKFIYFKIDLI